ncbi:MAG: diguanylate cyclase [Burkholderiales bacterium]
MLDASTLLIVLVVSNLLMAGAMCVAFAGRFREGMAQWTAALIVQGFSWTLIYNRSQLPPAAAAVAHASLVYCWSLQVSAILEFHRRSTSNWLLYSPAVAAFLLSITYLRVPRVPLIVGGFVFGIAQLLTAAAILHYQVAAAPRTRVVLSGSFFLMSAGLMLLGFTAWFEPEAILPTFGQSPVPGPSLFAFYAVTIGSSFAFLLMHKEKADRETYKLATTDPLTGVYNRRTFQELAEPQLSRCRRARAPVALLILDLDHFKRVNDTHGHLVGDEVLKAFASVVRDCLRKEDLLARYGGEEFVVLLPGSSPRAAMALGERIRELVATTPLDAIGEALNITVSVGVTSEAGEDAASLETMLGRADEALYAAKAQGRNRVVALDSALRGPAPLPQKALHL